MIEYFLTECQIYICGFHREQAWERRLANSSNGLVLSRNVILAKLQAIARARTEADYHEKVAILKTSEQWKVNTKLCNWIGNAWLPQHKVRNFMILPIRHAVP